MAFVLEPAGEHWGLLRSDGPESFAFYLRNWYAGVLPGEEMQAFHRDVIRGFGVRESLAFHTLYLNDEVVAVYYGFYEKEDAYSRSPWKRAGVRLRG